MNKMELKKAEDKESKALIVGAYVRILSGIHKGLYGQVQGLNFENARVMIKLTASANCTCKWSPPANTIKKANSLIFLIYPAYKEKYDEYKAKEDEKPLYFSHKDSVNC